MQWLAYAELVNDVWGEGNEIIPLGHWTHNPLRNVGGAHVPGRTNIRQSLIWGWAAPTPTPTAPEAAPEVAQETA